MYNIKKEMMDFEDQWKEEFMRNYIESLKQNDREQPKPSISMLEALKKKLKWK